uniref:p2-VA1 n=1 Tax=Rattus norvegicus TaxID=10116 RepID=Q63671_RAT|nr:P2-VA1 [Rattus norvegicus]
MKSLYLIFGLWILLACFQTAGMIGVPCLTPLNFSKIFLKVSQVFPCHISPSTTVTVRVPYSCDNFLTP